jgi:hypothetical protein
MAYDSSDLYTFELPDVTARRTYWDTVEHVDARGQRSPLAAPTAAHLFKHAQKFGPEMVNETAAQFGVTMPRLAVGTPKRQRRSGPTVNAQVLELHSRGSVPAAIADTLNLVRQAGKRDHRHRSGVVHILYVLPLR